MIEGPFPPTLDLSLDESRMRAELGPVVERRLGANVRIASLIVEHLHRRLVRYTLLCHGLENEHTIEWRVIGKLYNSAALMDASFNSMRMLWEGGFSHQAADGIRIPEPLDRVSGLCLLLMEEAFGVPLRRRVKEMTASPDEMRLFARAVAKLHRSRVIPGPPQTFQDRWLRWQPAAQKLAEAYPEMAEDIRYIERTATAIASDFGNDIFTATHGDSHLGQIHVENGKLWILDLDVITYSDPALDLAEVWVFLKRFGRKPKRHAYVTMLRDSFLSEYFSLMECSIARRVPLYECLMHIRRANKCYRVQDEEDWEENIKLLIPQGAACLRAMQEVRETPNLSSAIELYERCPGAF